MSNERDQDSIDELVSKTYQELNQETTPADLDRRVLDMANRGARAEKPAFARLFWIKPVAWAATIGLSLAIVLEIATVNDTVERAAISASEPPAAVQSDSVSDAFVPQDAAVMKDATERARLRAGSNQRPEPGTVKTATNETSVSETSVDADSLADAPQQTVPTLEQRAAEVAEADPSAALAAEKSVVSGATQNASPAPRSQLLQREEMHSSASSARESLQLDRQLETDQLKAYRLAPPDVAACDEDARKSAERWFDCIEAVRESGDAEDAERELAEFTLAHPNYLPKR